ncbi:MAG: glycosyltransferase family 4 protein, partial [Herminiimonas sp.]|nr:glycosyltransferase family 4 protein [Herminiimonas sp.]
VALDALELPFGDTFLFQYSILELNTAVKPWALQYLLDQGHEEVLYIDPDIYLYRPLADVTALLHEGAAIVLTPHLLAPTTDDLNPDDLAIRVAGTYNLGFCAIAERPSTRAFLAWWQSKLARNCVVEFASGIFVDQSWVDLVPAMFDDVAVLRHPGYNVAYWNLAQRDITGDVTHPLANGLPLMFFHFSGVDPQDPQLISKHQNRHRLNTVTPLVRDLFLGYCETVRNNGLAQYRAIPYGYASFSDGSAITQVQRTRLRLDGALRDKAAGRPFDHPDYFSNAALGIPSAESMARRAENPRLVSLYAYFLGREPDPTALENYRHACDTLSGYLRLAYGLARSAESRRNPGWKRRLALWPLWPAIRTLFPALVPTTVPDAVAAPSPPVRSVVVPPPVNKAPDSAALGINLVGYIAAELGIGEAARSLARACSAAGVPYSVVDVGYQSSNLQRDTQALANARHERFAIDVVYVNADQTDATLAHLDEKDLKSAYKIGFWHWEQPSIPVAHRAAFTHLDEIWVPSAFVYHAVAAVSPVPVVIIPHALQVSASPNVQRSQFGLPEDKLLALVMYDFHSYQYRKNPQAAIAAFRQAAAGRSDAVLVVKTINGHHHPAAAAELESHLAGLPGTIVIQDFLTRQQTWDLQSCCDLLISLHRAEGFGLAPAEMMALGKPVVATGWSANMDFMTTDNSMPVKYRLEPLAHAIGAYEAGPLWAEADIDHAATCIGQLLDQPALRQRLGEQAARDIHERYHPAAVGKLVKDRLSAIVTWNPELLERAGRGKDNDGRPQR